MIPNTMAITSVQYIAEYKQKMDSLDNNERPGDEQEESDAEVIQLLNAIPLPRHNDKSIFFCLRSQ